MPRFDRTRKYVSPKGRTFGKGVWYDDNGKMIKPDQGVYSKGSKTVTQYNTDGTTTKLSRQQWAKTKQRDTEVRAIQNDRKYAIPFIPSKKMTIHVDKDSPTARNRGAVISENLLDSIAVNAQKAGLPFRDAIGIASQESTLGVGDRKVGQTLLPWLDVLNQQPSKERERASKISYQGVQSPSLLISNWKPFTENTFAPYAEYLYNGQLNLSPKGETYYDQNFEGSVNRANRQEIEDASPLYQGFRSYKKAPTRYNGNDPTYPDKVRRAGDELVNHSPEIKAYMKKHNIHAEGGSLGSAWDSLSMADKSKVIEWAVKNGITNMEDIKRAYEEYVANASPDEDNAAPQGPTDEQYPEQYPPQNYPDYGEYQQEPEYIAPEEEYSFAEGGELGTSGSYTKALFSNLFDLKYGNPSSHYNNVDTALMRRLAPDSRGHYSDIVKLPNHPTSPARGTFTSDGTFFDLNDRGMENPNYTLFGMADNSDGASTLRYNGTYVLPEPTVTPQGNYYDDTYDNVKLYYEPPKHLANYL